MADRVVRDEIHRDILIPSSIGTLIDTKEFQRLRNVLQLSTCYYVFPLLRIQGSLIPLVRITLPRHCVIRSRNINWTSFTKGMMNWLP